jgi:two-component system, cell cycle sensor histidine kinase and response regulator CckA
MSGGIVVAHPEKSMKGAPSSRIRLFDPPSHGAFDTVAELAANRCGTAMAIVNVTDADGCWAGSRSAAERKRSVSMSVFVRSGTSRDLDPVLLADPEVALARAVPFYASIPITAGEGHKLGTITVIDESVRDIDAPAIADLKLLARLVIDSIELRLSARAELEARG